MFVPYAEKFGAGLLFVLEQMPLVAFLCLFCLSLVLLPVFISLYIFLALSFVCSFFCLKYTVAYHLQL